jgi:hypothetical protein
MTQSSTTAEAITQTAKTAEAKFLLRKILAVDAQAGAFAGLWISERARWTELAFSLLTRVTHLPQKEVRRVTNELDALDLLDITELAAMPTGAGAAETNIHARRTLEHLEGSGFEAGEARRGLATLQAISTSLVKNHGGKIQKCLRQAGEHILTELTMTFALSSLSEEEAGHALTFWLQNVLSLPLSLKDEAVLAFCTHYGLTPEQLTAAADELDINIALVDDLVQLHLAREMAYSSEQQPGKNAKVTYGESKA